MSQPINPVIDALLTTFDAVLDPLCVVNRENKIVHFNSAMKSFFGMTARELAKHHVFCDLLKLAACEKSCEVLKVIKSGKAVRLDETPASYKERKMRLLLKVVPLHDPRDPGKKAPIGAIITLRDSTAEILVQAKYQKLLQLLEEKDDKILQMEERMLSIRKAIR
jgi:PAS domain S-box-containing protein